LKRKAFFSLLYTAGYTATYKIMVCGPAWLCHRFWVCQCKESNTQKMFYSAFNHYKWAVILLYYQDCVCLRLAWNLQPDGDSVFIYLFFLYRV